MLTRLRSGDGNQHQGGQKAEEIVDLHVVRKYLTYRHVQYAGERDRGDALHDRIADRFGADQLHVRGAIVFVDLLEPLALMILGVENLDQAMRIDGFLGDPRDVAHGILNALAVAAKAAVGDSHQPPDDGRRNDAKYGEAPVHIEEGGEQYQDAETVADQGDRRAGRRRRHQLDVVGQLREQMSGLLLIQIRRGQAQVVREHIVPQALDDLSPHPARKVALHIVPDAPQGEQHHDPNGHLPEDRGILHQERAVQELAHKVSERGVGRREQDRTEHADQKHSEMGLGVFQQPPIDRPGIAGSFRDR